MIKPAPRDSIGRDEVLSLLELRTKVKALVIGADEVAEWEANLLDELVKEHWLTKIEPARVIACDGCHDDHVEEVIILEEPVTGA